MDDGEDRAANDGGVACARCWYSDSVKLIVSDGDVMGDITDDLGSIFANLREAALTMQQGGGVGYGFSTL